MSMIEKHVEGDSKKCYAFISADDSKISVEDIKALLYIDMSPYADAMKIDVYVPKKYECPVGISEFHMENTHQNRACIATELWHEGYDCFAFVHGVSNNDHSLTIWLSDDDMARYEVYPRELPTENA